VLFDDLGAELFDDADFLLSEPELSAFEPDAEDCELFAAVSAEAEPSDLFDENIIVAPTAITATASAITIPRVIFSAVLSFFFITKLP
jgi:hypothetical protein